MNKISDFTYRKLRNLLRPCSVWLLSEKRKHHTWVYEFIVAGTILTTVTILTTNWHSLTAIIANWAGAFGVFFSLGHAKVSSRMMEEQAEQATPSISCYKMAEHYWFLKEFAWLTAFITSGMYSALVGNAIFFLYPIWRKIHIETRKQVRK